MRSFFRDRGLELAAAVLIMLAIAILQAGISYTMTFGELRDFTPGDVAGVVHVLIAIRFCLVALMVVLWLAKRRHQLLILTTVTNAFFTVALLIHTAALIGTLSGSVSEAIHVLMLDVVLMVVSNILIFSIWYWIIDPPGLDAILRAEDRWEFLFPQRAGTLPHYESWVPHYADYLYLAFTSTFAFSPTDTLPLTRRAKALMLVQAAISVVTLTGIAGGAINILAGRH